MKPSVIDFFCLSIHNKSQRCKYGLSVYQPKAVKVKTFHLQETLSEKGFQGFTFGFASLIKTIIAVTSDLRLSNLWMGGALSSFQR